MNSTLRKWLLEFNEIELPVFPATYKEMSLVLAHENIDVGDIAAEVGKDVGLVLRLLRRVNRWMERKDGKAVASLRHALMIMGIEQIKRGFRELPSAEDLEPNLRHRYLALQVQAFAAAHQARMWATYLGDEQPEEAYIGALLQFSGEMVLEIHRPDAAQQIRKLVHQDGTPLDEAQYTVLGFSLDEMTRELARIWLLPDVVMQCLYPENARYPRYFGVQLAVKLSRTTAARGWYSDAVLELEQAAARHLGTDLGKAVQKMHQHAVESAHLCHHLRGSKAAHTLIHPVPFAWLNEEQQALLAQEQPKAPRRQRRATLCLAYRADKVQECLRKLKHELSVETTKVKLAVRLAMTGLHDGVALNRVVFALLNQERTTIRARSIIGSDDDPVFNQFAIPVGQNNLFQQLLVKPMALWVNAKNRPQLAPGIPSAFQEQIEVEHFFVTSVVVKGETIGLFYADRGSRDCKLESRSFNDFKRITKLATDNLNRIR